MTWTETLRELASHIVECQSDAVIDADVTDFGELDVSVAPQKIAEFADWLKTDERCRFTTLIDITAVDYPANEQRFTVVYHLLSMHLNHRIRLRTSVRESGELVPSLVEVHPSANWFEREVFDMYGLLFSGHPDLRRILTDYGFQGHPLRKDFPTTGFTQVRYDEVEKRVVQEPVSLVQEYRSFDFTSPWEGIGTVLGKPGEATDPDAGKDEGGT